MEYELRLYRDQLQARAPASALAAGSAVRVIYVVEGALRLRTADSPACLSANSAWQGASAVQLSGTHAATAVLRWELVRRGAPPGPLQGPGAASTLALSAPLSLDASQPCLLRCDRVDFPPRGEALTHTHRGPGIRCLLSGGIRIETGGAAHTYAPPGAWFETGPDPVYAAAAPHAATAFARVMILPRELLGKPSIRYVKAEDLDKPKSQSYQIFIDEPIELPGAGAS